MFNVHSGLVRVKHVEMRQALVGAQVHIPTSDHQPTLTVVCSGLHVASPSSSCCCKHRKDRQLHVGGQGCGSKGLWER